MRRALRLGAVAALCTLLALPALSQPERGRILRGLEMKPMAGVPGGTELRIRTGLPVRYVRHAPRGRTDRVTIQFTPLVRNAEDLLARAGREALPPPPGAPVGLEEVLYQGVQAGDGILELRFSERVEIEAGQGPDLRSLVVKVLPSGTSRPTAARPVPTPRTAAPQSDREGVTILLSDPGSAPAIPFESGSGAASAAVPLAKDEARPELAATPPAPAPSASTVPAHPKPARVTPEPEPPAPGRVGDAVELSHPFALQLFAGPEEVDLPRLPAERLDGLRLYAVPFDRDGEPWRRLRLGFVASQAEAVRLQRELADLSPDAWIVEVDLEERLASSGLVVEGSSGLAVEPSPGRDADPQSEEIAASGAAPDPPPSSQEERPLEPPFESARTSIREDAPPIAPDPLTAEQAETVTRLLGEGRAALSKGEHDRAVQLFTQVRGFPENEHSAEALEWLALARERKGQEAHARAEYEDYLKLYPEGEGADRVRQRLDALLTARSMPQEPLRQAAPDRGPRVFDSFGSFSTSYRRDERMTRSGGDIVVDSSVFSDVFVATRGETEAWDLRSELSGSHVQDFVDRDSEVRVSTLFVEALGRSRPWGFGLGRLPGNRSGVNGRYDGGRISYSLTPSSRISVVGGLPVEPFVTSSIQTDQQLVGLSFEALEWWEGLDVELFAIQQWADGLTDRTAVGTEFSYTDGVRFLAGQIDYDLHFTELNTAFVIGSWQLDPATYLNLLLDWRRLPFLATRNALFGQPESDLDDLRDRFGTSALEGLAEDRTARSRSATLGVTRQLTERFQLAADLGVSDLSGTPSSGGIESFDGTGLQVQSFVQVIGTELLRSGDVGNVGVRIVVARDVDVLGLVVGWRSPLWRKFRFNPLMDLTWRGPARGSGVLTARPGLRIDYRVGPFTLDFDGRYVWSDGERFPGVEDEQGYTLVFGVRYDY